MAASRPSGQPRRRRRRGPSPQNDDAVVVPVASSSTASSNEPSATPSHPSMATRALRLLTLHPLIIGLLLRLVVMTMLPALLDDGLLLDGVRYTDIDYDVFTDAADHVAEGRSPFARHTYRYTPFLAALLALPARFMTTKGSSSEVSGELRGVWRDLPRVLTWWLDRRYFGRLLFCVADALCGYVILCLRRKRRRERSQGEATNTTYNGAAMCDTTAMGALRASPELHDALWWLYNPLPINICTRGSAESFVVLLPVLLTVAIATSGTDGSKKKGRGGGGRLEVAFRAFLAGMVHGVAVHAKLYPVIYTVSFMASFSLQEQSSTTSTRESEKLAPGESESGEAASGSPSQHEQWTRTLPPARPKLESEGNRHGQTTGTATAAPDLHPFPWTDPPRLLRLITLWAHRLLLTPSSLIFLTTSVSTFASLTYLAVRTYGPEAWEEGFLYHLSRVDHRHNYSMHWYWIYLARGRIARAAAAAGGGSVLAASSSSTTSMAVLGRVLLVPQAMLLLYSSLGVTPRDLPLALFVQTFLFVAHNKVITAQYFTWYLCLLPLCSEGVVWGSRRMGLALTFLGMSVLLWLGSAYCLEMRGLPVHSVVWAASVVFFVANVNLLGAILSGSYAVSGRREEQACFAPVMSDASARRQGEDAATKKIK